MICALYLCLSLRVTSTCLRIFDYVVVGEDAAIFAEDEPGSLSLARHDPIEEVEGQLGGSDIHYRWQDAFVDRDAIGFFLGDRPAARLQSVSRSGD